MSQHILYVEDEAKLATLIRDYLVAEDFTVTLLHSGDGVVDCIKNHFPDLILLDLMLPGVDGLSLCKKIRSFSNVPIIMLTAKVEGVDCLVGLESGADDYICKPARPREIVARIKAKLRRISFTQDTKLPLVLNYDQFSAFWHGQALELTRVEFALLKALASKPGWVYSRAQLLASVHYPGTQASDRSIDSHIKNLRKKLIDKSHIENPIVSVYGAGYKLEIE
jgi:two-component system, OmpR family, response regulator BaeR